MGVSGSVAMAAKHISSRRIDIAYPMPKDNLSGISKIEVWITWDSGRTWRLYGTDPDLTSPAYLELNRDGPLGVTLLPYDSANPPNANMDLVASGARPMFNYVLDSQAPVVRLVLPKGGTVYETGDIMDVLWIAEDANIADDGIQIEYALDDSAIWRLGPRPRAGKSELSWEIPASLEGRLRLRITAVDRAGHRTQDELTKPVLISERVKHFGVRITGPAKTREDVLDIHYEINKLKPEEVGMVALYQTLNNGQTWTVAARDHDNRSPVSYRVPDQDKVGLYLVAGNQKGRREAPPVAGARPMHVLCIDKKVPVLTVDFDVGVEPWRGRSMRILKWRATDQNLADKPVAVYFSKDGRDSWELLSTSPLEAAGEIQFNVPPLNTASFRLRFEAKDLFHNVGTISSPPITVISVPRSILEKNARKHYKMGNQLRIEGRLYEATEAYRKAIEIWPEYYEAINDLAYTYFQLENHESALEFFNKACKFHPEDADIWYNVGVAQFYLDHRTPAIEAFGRALEIDPNLVEAYWYIGKISIENRDKAEAIKAWKRIVLIAPPSSQWHRGAKDLLVKYK